MPGAVGIHQAMPVLLFGSGTWEVVERNGWLKLSGLWLQPLHCSRRGIVLVTWLHETRFAALSIQGEACRPDEAG